MFQENPGGNTAGNDKWVIGYDDSSGFFAIHDAATIPTTIRDARVSISANAMYVTTNDSGATVNSNYDDLVVEVAATGGITILGPDATELGLVFGNVTQPINAAITMQSNDKLRMFTSVDDGEIKFATDVDSLAMTIDKNQHVVVHSGSLTVIRSGIQSGSDVNIGADDLVIDASNSAGMSILTKANFSASVFLGANGSANDAARIQWADDVDLFHIGTNYAGAEVRLRTDTNTLALTLGSDQSATFVGDVVAESNLDVEGYAAIGDGSSLDADWTLTVDRDFSSTTNPRMLNIRGIMTVTAGTSNLYGLFADTSMVINSASAEVHPEVAQFYISDPDISLGGTSPGTLTLAATLLVDGKPTEGTKNAGIWVQSGSSTATPDTGANTLVIEGSDPDGTGASILSANGKESRLYFGSPADGNGARITWGYNAGLLSIASYVSGANVELFSGTGTAGITIAGNSGDVTVDGTTTSTGDIIAGGDIGLSGDQDLISLAANLVTVNGALTTTGVITTADDLIVDGTNIGITTDLDLITLALNLLTVTGALTVSLDLIVEGGDIGIAADTDLLALAANAFTINGAVTQVGAFLTSLAGDLLVDGGDIGITGDTDLMQLSSAALTVNGSLSATSFVSTPLISLTGSTGDYLQFDAEGTAPNTAAGSVKVDVGGAVRYLITYSSL
jgi:hypothetical protein